MGGVILGQVGLGCVRKVTVQASKQHSSMFLLQALVLPNKQHLSTVLL